MVYHEMSHALPHTYRVQRFTPIGQEHRACDRCGRLESSFEKGQGNFEWTRDLLSRSILHGYKLILTSLLLLMGISTFTSKEFSFFQGIWLIGNVVVNNHNLNQFMVRISFDNLDT